MVVISCATIPIQVGPVTLLAATLLIQVSWCMLTVNQSKIGAIDVTTMIYLLIEEEDIRQHLFPAIPEGWGLKNMVHRDTFPC